MERGAIAFVPGKFITRMPRLHLEHDAVARDLREHARRCDAEAQSIAAHERRLGKRERAHGPAIDQYMARRHRERGRGAAHRLVRGAQDLEAVDLVVLDHGHGPHDALVGRDLGEKAVALPGRELLRIVESAIVKIRGKHDGGGDYGAGERAAAGFIDAGDWRATLRKERLFVVHGAGHGTDETNATDGALRPAYAAAFSRTAIACLPLRLRR